VSTIAGTASADNTDARAATERWRDRVRGMMLGGALGDALGGVIEFDGIDGIRARFGPQGITEPTGSPADPARITDDTQMTLFTLEGLIRAHRARSAHRVHRSVPTGGGLDQAEPAVAPPVPGSSVGVSHGDLSDVATAVHAAYLRWLQTQHPDQPYGSVVPEQFLNGWLLAQPELHHRRAPGSTCLGALQATSAPGTPPGSITHPLNNSKGCGAVMRVAPVALWPGFLDTTFQLGIETAALTHSHPSGYLSAGMLALTLRELLTGASLLDALDTVSPTLARSPGSHETSAALDAAVRLAGHDATLAPEEIAAELGGGWVGEQALAIAVYAALRAKDFTDGVRIAVNHSGDSDSTGAIAGTILGACVGYTGLSQRWLARVELTDVIEELVADALEELHDIPTATRRIDANHWPQRYPV
jgi:ADP-ribosylglycohydrolase